MNHTICKTNKVTSNLIRHLQTIIFLSTLEMVAFKYSVEQGENAGTKLYPLIQNGFYPISSFAPISNLLSADSFHSVARNLLFGKEPRMLKKVANMDYQ